MEKTDHKFECANVTLMQYFNIVEPLMWTLLVFAQKPIYLDYDWLHM